MLDGELEPVPVKDLRVKRRGGMGLQLGRTKFQRRHLRIGRLNLLEIR